MGLTDALSWEGVHVGPLALYLKGRCSPEVTEEFEVIGLGTVRVWECDRCDRTFEEVDGAYEFCPRCGRRVCGDG